MTDDIKQAIKEAIKEGVAEALAKPPRVRRRQQAPHEIQIFTDEQLCQWWDWFNTHWLEPTWHRQAFAVGVILSTGLRAFEAAKLRVDCCHDRPEAIIDVEHGKGDKYRRADVLPQFVPHYERFLQERVDLRRQYMFTPKYQDRPVTVRQIFTWWVDATTAAGLPKTGPHCGRRCFITYAPRIKFQGPDDSSYSMDLVSLREQVGHADLKTTQRHYLASLPGTRFGQKRIEWPDHVCPGWEPPKRIRIDLPEDEASLLDIQRRVAERLAKHTATGPTTAPPQG